jgi:hypothetical protein
VKTTVRQKIGTGLALVGSLAMTGATATAASAHTTQTVQERTFYGPAQRLGDGIVQTYVVYKGKTPLTLGYRFTANALKGLPADGSDGKHCYPIEQADKTTVECVEEYGYALALPRRATEDKRFPFTWALLTWDPHGHAPAEIYGGPHFDFHFYMQSEAAVNAIGTGPCAGLMNCADLQKALIPVPAKYKPAVYQDVGAVVPGMGNHLMDMDSPEFHGHPFTQTFMYGAYGGNITFYEPMITKAWIEGLAAGRQGSCTTFPQPLAWKKAGWYPTAYCLGYGAKSKVYTVSIADFAYRKAS